MSADAGKNGIKVSFVGPSLASGSGILLNFRSFFDGGRIGDACCAKELMYTSSNDGCGCISQGGREWSSFITRRYPTRLLLDAGVHYFEGTPLTSSRDDSVVCTPQRSRRFLRLPFSFTALTPDQSYPLPPSLAQVRVLPSCDGAVMTPLRTYKRTWHRFFHRAL